MSNKNYYILIDDNAVLADIASMHVVLSNQPYSIFVDPSPEVRSYISLSSLQPEKIEHLHLLLFASENIHYFNDPTFNKLCVSIIKDDAYSCFLYASLHLKDRFPEGEAAMEGDKEIWVAYCHMLNNSFKPTTYSGKRVAY